MNLILDISITAVGAVVIEGGVLRSVLQDWTKHKSVKPKYHDDVSSVTLRQTKGSKSPELLSGLADQGPDMKQQNRIKTKGHYVGYDRNISWEDLAAGVQNIG